MSILFLKWPSRDGYIAIKGTLRIWAVLLPVLHSVKPISG